jgi:hypothetical protein
MKRKTSAICIGTYPKWMARIIRWAIRKNKSSTVEVQLRGRGKYHGVRYTHGIPLSKGSHAAIYLHVKKSMRFVQSWEAQERKSYEPQA